MMERTNKFLKKSCGAIAVALTLVLALTACTQKDNAPQETTKMATTASQAVSQVVATINVNCTGVLKNMDKVPANKKQYVPADGIILNKEKVEVKEGETAFAFIKRLSQENNIQIDYDSATGYVTSLGNLNEKDCGPESGWMFKVNGENATVGANEYIVKDGDVIEFFYILSYSEAF